MLVELTDKTKQSSRLRLISQTPNIIHPNKTMHNVKTGSPNLPWNIDNILVGYIIKVVKDKVALVAISF